MNGTTARRRAAALAVRCGEGARAAAAWAATKQAPDGLLDGEEAWLYSGHKGLAGFTAGGYHAEAGRLASWLATNRLGPDGDLGSPADRDGPARSAWLYFNAWVTWGAHRAGRFDLSGPAARFLATRQETDGGFVSNPHGPEEVLDLFVTSAAGLALLETGWVEEAERAAAWVKAALDRQPREDGVTIAWARNADGQAALEGSPERAFVRFDDEERQNYFTVGMALVFLARLHLATGDGGIRAAAIAYRDGAARMPGAARCGQGGKIGWGAALWHGITGEAAWLDLAEPIVDGYLLGTQAEDGRWPRDHPVVETDTAFEFGFILAEAAHALAGGPPEA